MAHAAQPGLLAVALAEPPGVRVGDRGVRFVAAPLAVEVTAGVAATAGRLVALVLGPKALQARPGLDQRAVDREVLAAQEVPNPRVAEHRRQEFGCDLALTQPLAVGRERGRVPHRSVDPEPHEPAEQKVVVQLFHQQPLRAHRVERLQQQRPQQPLGRDRGAAQGRVQRLELARQRAQGVIDDRPDRPQRVIRRYPGFEINLPEQTAPPPLLAPQPPHPASGCPPGPNYQILRRNATFSAAC